MPGSGPKLSESPAPGYAQLILRVLRRAWNPSLVKLEAEHGDLRAQHAELQTISEELKSANEELQSAKEALKSDNREIQSANEKLKSDNQELQSANTKLESDNKELRSVSNELRIRDVEAKARIEEINARCEEITARCEQISGHHEQEQAANRNLAEECRQRAELLLFEMRNHFPHLRARLTDAALQPSDHHAATSDQAAEHALLSATLDACRLRLAQLVDDSRNGFAQLNEWLDGLLEPPERLGYAEAFDFLRSNLSWLRLPPDAFDPRRVLMIGATLGPGGGERQLAMTARGLKATNLVDVRVIGTNIQTTVDAFFKPDIEEAGIPVTAPDTGALDGRALFLLAVLRRFGPPDFHYLARDILALARELQQERAGIVHCWQDQTNVIGGFAAQIVGVPRLVLSCRSLTPVDRPVFQPYMQPAYADLLTNPATLMLNNSRAGADDYARWLGLDARRITVIQNGYELPAASPPGEALLALRKSLGIPPDAPVIGSIIRFSEIKRPDLLMDAFTHVLEARSDAHAVTFGDGPMREETRRRAHAAPIAGRLHLPGFTSEIWTALGIMDLFVLASRVEGLPNVLIEAQAAGVPVISTDVGGARDAYEENVTGWSVAADISATDLGERCLQILNDDPRRRAAGKKARTFVREKFGADRMIAETLAVYRQEKRPPTLRRDGA